MNNVERRDSSGYVATGSPAVQKSRGGTVISGYGAVFYNPRDSGTEYQLKRDTRERIAPTAFNSSLASGRDIVSCFNHEFSNLLARTSSGTLKLSVDSRGLKYEFPIDPNDPDHQRVAAKIRRGDLCGSSFIMGNIKDEVQRVGDGYVRTITDVTLYEVGPVSTPAYTGTTAGTRGEHKESVREYNDRLKRDPVERARHERARVLERLDQLARDERTQVLARVERINQLERLYAR